MVAEQEALGALVLERVEPARVAAAAVVVDLPELAAVVVIPAWINEIHVRAKGSIRKIRNRMD